jgi:hypothetical protein
VQYQQLLMRIYPYPRDPVALHAVADGQGVAAEHIRQERDGLVAAFRNVHPDQYIVAFEEGLDLGHRMGLDTVRGEDLDLDPGHGFTLDPKESQTALPLSEKKVNRSESDRMDTLRAAGGSGPHEIGPRPQPLRRKTRSAGAFGIENVIWSARR